MAKRTKKSKRRLIIWTLLIIIMLSYMSVFSYNYWSQILKNRKEAAELAQKYEDLLDEEIKLNNEVSRLQDPEYVAEYARENYSMSKEGEIIIKVIEDEEM